MKFVIRNEEKSIYEFGDSVAYYESISTLLADRFNTEFWNTIENIKVTSLHYQ
jgi:hypothetical protein